MSFKFEDKLLSALAKCEILKLPGMSQYKDLPVKELKVKMNEFCKTHGLKRGSKVKDFISVQKKVDDELFKNGAKRCPKWHAKVEE